MAAFGSFLKTVFVPALVAVVIYAVVIYALLPLWRRHRNRYSQYLPIQSISQRTSGLRGQLQTAFFTWLIPSSWRTAYDGRAMHMSSGDDEDGDELFSDGEGEALAGFDIGQRRREALDRRRSGIAEDSDRRLSRDLEEGFRDDSDDETPEPTRQSLDGSR